MLADQLTTHLNVTAQQADSAVLPVDHGDAHRLYDAAGGASRAIGALRGSIARECFGNPDRLGLCGECGKVIDPPAAGHDPGGCMQVIALGVVALVRLPKRLKLRARFHWRRLTEVR